VNSQSIVNTTDSITSLKVSSFGNFEIKTNESVIYVKRFFIGETTAILLINTDTNLSYKFERIFKAFGILNKKLDIAYSSTPTDLKQITIDKYGECFPSGSVLQPVSSVLLTYPYEPPGFKELL
jgi:hypothetical protein